MNAVLNDVHIFTPALVNEARFGYTRHNGSQVVLNADEGVAFARQNGIAVYPFPAQTFPQTLFSYSGSSTGGSTEFSTLGSGGPNLNIENLFEGADDLSWVKGKHSLKMGVDVRRDRFDTVYGGGETVYGSIFTSSTGAPNSGAPLADFLLGYPAQVTGTQLLDWARMRQLYFGTYVQDDWKVSSRAHDQHWTSIRTVYAARRCSGSRGSVQCSDRAVCGAGPERLFALHCGKPSFELRPTSRICLQPFQPMDIQRRGRAVLWSARTESVRHGVRGKPAERSHGDLARD